jgi:hypothetical protein
MWCRKVGTGQRRRLGGDRCLVQRTDRDQGPLPVKLPQQRRSVLSRGTDRPLGRHHQQPAVRQAATDQGRQHQRRRICIVHVVQDDQQRPVGGSRSEDVDDCAVQRDPGPVRVQGWRRLYLAGPGQLWDQVDQPGHGRGMQPGRHLGCMSQGAEGLLPKPIRRRRLSHPRPPPHHRPALPGGRHGHLLGERRLADPRLPNQLHRPLRTTPRPGHRRRDRFQLPRATHQHRLTVRA